MKHWPFVALALSAGCATKGDLETVRRDLGAHERRLAGDSAAARKASAHLQALMERATGPLTRNSADLGAQMDRVEADYA